MKKLIRIDSGHFIAGAIIENDECIKCAPIIKYLLGWDVQEIKNYCERKKWKLVEYG
jgi:hypothetical protein